MADASPSDLVVAFRSLPRRLKEVGADLATPGSDGQLVPVIERLEEAGRLLRTTGDPDAIAAAIEAVPARGWDDAVLARLRAIALDIGTSVRQLGAESSRDDDADG